MLKQAAAIWKTHHSAILRSAERGAVPPRPRLAVFGGSYNLKRRFSGAAGTQDDLEEGNMANYDSHVELSHNEMIQVFR